MSDLPQSLFANPVWNALRSVHRQFSLAPDQPRQGAPWEGAPWQGASEACRYPADVVPFLAIAAPTPNAMAQAHSLMAIGEAVWVIADKYVESPGLQRTKTLDCLQMVMPKDVLLPEPTPHVVPLNGSNAAEMVYLTDLAFPGFFRPRTFEMGSYFGVRSPDGQLIAMGGERLKLAGYSEISAVCTHPDFRGQALGTQIIWEILRMQRRQGVISFLHVGSANVGAVRLYLRMGFRTVRTVVIHQITRLAGRSL